MAVPEAIPTIPTALSVLADGCSASGSSEEVVEAEATPVHVEGESVQPSVNHTV